MKSLFLLSIGLMLVAAKPVDMGMGMNKPSSSPSSSPAPSPSPSESETPSMTSSDSVTASPSPSPSTIYDYLVVIDAGSTGSRVRVYRVPINQDENSAFSITELSVSGNQVTPGLSTILPANVPAYLTPLINSARNVVPLALQSSAPIHVYGTAGMRLLPDSTAEDIWNAVRTFLLDPNFSPFIANEKWIHTLSGEQEAALGALTVSFLRTPATALFPDNPTPTGVLELGGASTQIGFQPDVSLKSGRYELYFEKGPVAYFVDSFLKRGQDQVILAVNYVLTGTDTPPAGSVDHPCHPVGYTETVSMTFTNGGVQSVTFVGAGDWQICYDLIKTNILHLDYECTELTCSAMGRYLPATDSSSFTAISAFYFLLGNMGLVSSNAPFTGTLQVVKDSGINWCARTDGASLIGVPFLPTTCLISAYTIALFHDAYKFPLDGNQITWANRVNGFTVTWTLGAAITIAQNKEIYGYPI